MEKTFFDFNLKVLRFCSVRVIIRYTKKKEGFIMLHLLSKTAQKNYQGASVLELLRATDKLTAKDRQIIETVRETIKTYAIENINATTKFTSSRMAMEYFKLMLRDCQQEELWVSLLDTKNAVIGTKLIFKGTINSSIAHPREIFSYAVKNNATRIMIAHNHPSGNTDPSHADLMFTRRMIEAGEMMGIELMDHIIVGDDVISLRETTDYWD